MVFAAASLTDVLKETATAYEKQSGDKISFNFGASSLLERQIEEGGPADIFFSADEAKMDALAAKDLILKETRKSRLSNSLVIVTSADSELKIPSPSDLTSPKVRRIALADPKAVLTGVFSKAFLEKEKLWLDVEPKVVPVDNVRAALAAVESGISKLVWFQDRRFPFIEESQSHLRKYPGCHGPRRFPIRWLSLRMQSRLNPPKNLWSISIPMMPRRFLRNMDSSCFGKRHHMPLTSPGGNFSGSRRGSRRSAPS